MSVIGPNCVRFAAADGASTAHNRAGQNPPPVKLRSRCRPGERRGGNPVVGKDRIALKLVRDTGLPGPGDPAGFLPQGKRQEKPCQRGLPCRRPSPTDRSPQPFDWQNVVAPFRLARKGRTAGLIPVTPNLRQINICQSRRSILLPANVWEPPGGEPAGAEELRSKVYQGSNSPSTAPETGGDVRGEGYRPPS